MGEEWGKAVIKSKDRLTVMQLKREVILSNITALTTMHAVCHTIYSNQYGYTVIHIIIRERSGLVCVYHVCHTIYDK